MRVLLVEDEAPLRETLAARLQREGFAVDTAADGDEAVYMGREVPFDVAIVDLGLPKLPGLEVVKRLRESGRRYPILILTARGSWEDKVEGLKCGADDYLVKPFQFPELLARVRALLKRRQAVATDPTLRVGDLEIDPIRHRATRGGQRIQLTAKEFALLSLLAERSGEVLSRTQIASLVWDIHFDSDSNVVEVAVRRLRAKVDDPFADKLIHTVRGVGYVLDHRPGA